MFFFAKGISPICNNHYYREVINDIDQRIVNLYRHLRDSPELMQLLYFTPYSRVEYEKARCMDKIDGLENAWAMYVSMCMSFSNIVDGAFGTGVYSNNSSASWRNRVDRLQEMVDRLRGVVIECDSAIDVIRRWDSPQTLFYCDPPYPETRQRYKFNFDILDYQELCDCLDDIEGSFVLSSYATGMEPDYWKRIDIDSYLSSSAQGQVGKNRSKRRSATKEEIGDRKRTESIFIVDRSKNVRKELIDKMWSPSLGFPYRDMKQRELEKEYKTDLLDDLFDD